MGFPIAKPPLPAAAIGAAIGVPAGKKMSVRNMLRARKGAKTVRRPKAGADSESEYC